jgi:RecA-family ATPase
MSPHDLHQLAAMLSGEVSRDQILCPGPGHSAKDRSLSVKLDASAPDGFVTHSFAKDDPIVCRDHVRIKWGLPAFKPHGRLHSLTSEEIQKRVRAAVMAQVQKPKGFHSATYDYVDADGQLLYQVLRYDNPKTFRQRRPHGNGWIWELGERRVLYRLPELVKYPHATVFVPEGEKDADRVAGLDYCATTVASGKWTDECVQALAGRDIIILEDNDDAGRKKAWDAAALLHAVASTVRVVSLPGLPQRGDVSDWLDAGHNAEELVEVCFAAPLCKPAHSELPPKERSASEASTAAPTGVLSAPESRPEVPLQFIDVARWHGQPVPDREWCVLNRIPMRNVTLFSGEGAIGKSIVSLQLSVAHVLGKDWLSTMPELGPVINVACEDDADELHRRLSLILAHYSMSFADLKDLHLLSLAGQDALLATPDKNGLIKPTKLLGQLITAACDIRPKLIVLDNSADLFGGNENDRTQVRQFIGVLRGLAIAADAGVLLTSHPSLTGMNSGTGLSGSTAWNASVRSRLYMKRATTEKDEEPDPNLRVIEVMKSNYGPVGETITVRWRDGVFVPVATMGTLDRVAAEKAADDLFLKLLERFRDQGRNVSDKKTANNYAPTMLSTDPDGKGRRKDLADAMARLFAAGTIKMESYGRPSRLFNRMVRCG